MSIETIYEDIRSERITFGPHLIQRMWENGISIARFSSYGFIAVVATSLIWEIIIQGVNRLVILHKYFVQWDQLRNDISGAIVAMLIWYLWKYIFSFKKQKTLARK